MDPEYSELLEQFSRSVVRIHIQRLVVTSPETLEEEWEPIINLCGIVTVAESTFCHIIVCGRKFFNEPSKHRYEVIFADGTSVVFDVNTVEENRWLASFYVPTVGKKADAVQISNQNAACRDEVWMFGYDHYSESLLDRGSITHIGVGKFDHDVPPNSYTCFGYPAFSLDKKLVGVSYYDFGVTHTVDVKQITDALAAMVEGMEGKTLLEILERIKVVGEAKYKELQDLAPF